MAVPMLTRTELLDRLMEVEETGITKKQMADALDCLAYVGKQEIGQGRRFRIPQLGTIEVRLRKAIRKGTMVRNPATGEEQPHAGKPASTKVGFRALKPLNDALPTAQKAKAMIDKSKSNSKPRGKAKVKVGRK